ncbi:DUF4880 domain-containing protein [Janthinobacterium lividum]|nr:DUF4880 domain-containing protein [Janthinobacterium lividum]
MRLRGGALTPDEQQAFQAWRASDPAHETAWKRAELVCSTLASVPPALRQTADAAPQSPHRRAVLYGMAGLIAAGPALWLGSRSLPWQGWQAWRAAIRTARGKSAIWHYLTARNWCSIRTRPSTCALTTRRGA